MRRPYLRVASCSWIRRTANQEGQRRCAPPTTPTSGGCWPGSASTGCSRRPRPSGPAGRPRPGGRRGCAGPPWTSTGCRPASNRAAPSGPPDPARSHVAGSLASMLAARAGLSPVMVGRADELARLRQLAARADGPEVVLLAGEAGVGKTRLVAELVASLDPSVPVLAGRASQGAPGRPFELLLEAVEQQVAAWEAVPEPLAARAEPLRLLLGPVAPGIDRPAERDYGPEELLRAAGTLVRELAGPGPAGVGFQELYRAHAQSVALFGRLALAADLPALLVGTFRPEGVARRHPLVELLADLERQRSVTTIALERLDQPGVAALLAAVYGHPVPFRVSEALHRRTGGNPFFLEELVVTAGKAHPERLAALPLPWNLAEAVLRRP